MRWHVQTFDWHSILLKTTCPYCELPSSVFLMNYHIKVSNQSSPCPLGSGQLEETGCHGNQATRAGWRSVRPGPSGPWPFPSDSRSGRSKCALHCKEKQ